MQLKVYIILFSTVFINACVNSVIDTSNNKNRDINPGNIPINYYADKTVKSLVVPPDLTSPNSQKSFRVSEYVSGVNETIVDFSGSEQTIDDNPKILQNNSNVRVERSGQRRWLIINKNSDTVWDSAKDFLKQQGFSIKKSNKKIGILETDFLENYPEIPEKSLGLIRSMLTKALTARYTLPIIDKYRLRVEPIDERSTEVHLTLFSMQEKLAKSGNVESTIWETYEKDVALETEMLYRFMVYITGDEASSRQKIIEAKEKEITKTEILDNFNGYAKLRFNLDLLSTWDNINWALDQLNIDIEDKDIKEKTFYIRSVRTSDIGIMSTLLGTDALVKTYQIMLKSNGNNSTDVLFNDISGENEQETKDYSYEFFKNLKKVF